MSRKQDDSLGAVLAQRLSKAVRAGRCVLTAGARPLPVIKGVTPSFTVNRPLENILAEVEDILIRSERVYVYGNNIMMERGAGESANLVVLSTDAHVNAEATPLLANLFVCESGGENDQASNQFPPPTKLVATSLSREPTRAALRRIRLYSRRPIFGPDFVLRGPGWHDDLGILVHGAEIDPIIPEPVDPDSPIADRLPYHIREVLADFAFRSVADTVNAVGIMLTGILIGLFVELGKAVVLLDGNQPGIGKTLLARVIGMILDGENPIATHFTTDDEELGKRICATLREREQSIVLVDNAKVRSGAVINSPVIEANSMAPEISLRILGQSANYTRPNDLLWMLTMNQTKASADLVSRGVPIRFHFDGNPGERKFSNRDPITFARQNRIGLLGELVGMVTRWNQLGRPPGHQQHRCAQWSQIVGGILAANGLPEFLGNLNESAAEFNTELDELAALAEAAISSGTSGAFFVT